MSIEVMGINNLKLGLSITISPGSLPNGSFDNQGQSSPLNKIITPVTIKIF